MSQRWSREDLAGAAVEKILDAAEKAFIERGVAAAGMSEIAHLAGCSRGTVYRYFPTRHDLHLAYVNRAARQIGERVRDRLASLDDPRARLVEGIAAATREVRRNPATAAWFELGASGVAARMARASEVVRGLTTAFVSELLGRPGRDPERRLRARWLERVILSLLSSPGASEAEERALIERFVAPVLLPPAPQERAARPTRRTSR